MRKIINIGIRGRMVAILIFLFFSFIISMSAKAILSTAPPKDMQNLLNLSNWPHSFIHCTTHGFTSWNLPFKHLFLCIKTSATSAYSPLLLSWELHHAALLQLKKSFNANPIIQIGTIQIESQRKRGIFYLPRDLSWAAATHQPTNTNQASVTRCRRQLAESHLRFILCSCLWKAFVFHLSRYPTYEKMEAEEGERTASWSLHRSR